MTWTQRSNGSDTYVAVGSTLSLSSNNTTTLKFGNGNDDTFVDGANRVFGVNNNNNTNYGKVSASINRFRIQAFNVNTDFDWTDAAHSFVDVHVYSWEQDDTDTLFYVDGDLKATVLGDTRQIRMSNLMGNIGGVYSAFDLWFLTIADNTTSSNDRQFNADSSGGTGTVLPNDIGTDGTINGTVTWIDVSTGGITVSLDGIQSSEAFGGLNITASKSIQLSGVTSSEIVGDISLSKNKAIILDGIEPSEALGQIIASKSKVISLSGIESSEAFGTQKITKQKKITLTGIISSSAFGIIKLVGDAIVVIPRSLDKLLLIKPMIKSMIKSMIKKNGEE